MIPENLGRTGKVSFEMDYKSFKVNYKMSMKKLKL